MSHIYLPALQDSKWTSAARLSSFDFYVKLHSFFLLQRMRRILSNATCPPPEWASTSRLTFTTPTTAQAHHGIFLPCTWAPLSAGPPPLLRRTMKTHPPSATPQRRWRNPRRCTATCHQRLVLLFLPLNPPPESVCDLHLVTNTIKWQAVCVSVGQSSTRRVSGTLQEAS